MTITDITGTKHNAKINPSGDIEVDSNPKFKLGEHVFTDTGFEGKITSILPRIATEWRGTWIVSIENAYKIENNCAIVETESSVHNL